MLRRKKYLSQGEGNYRGDFVDSSGNMKEVLSQGEGTDYKGDFVDSSGNIKEFFHK